ncbi:MAG: flavodoxin family protein [Clostridiales bacterium]|nr:flavodoxin family protein [Clostridiales bacterium]
MNVLLINGSPHEKGCTHTALTIVSDILQQEKFQTTFFWIGDKNIHGCIHCNECQKNHQCAHNPFINEVISLATYADGFIFGSPVHYAAPSGHLTSFMDCLFYAAPKDVFALKPASAVVSARRAGTTAALDQIHKYFSLSQMPIITSPYWNMVHGNTPAEVLKDEEGVYVMKTLGRNMAYFLKCIMAGKLAGLPNPKKEDPKRTNFIR